MSSIATKTVRVIGAMLAILAMLGLIISSFPMSMMVPQNPEPTPPLENSRSDSPADFNFEVASTPEAREQGLSGRTEVPPGSGMLFVFDVPGSYGFWMKDMLMPIDMIWIDESGTMIGVTENVQPDSYPEAFKPPSPVLYVLETRPGEYLAQGWSVGEKIPLP